MDSTIINGHDPEITYASTTSASTSEHDQLSLSEAAADSSTRRRRTHGSSDGHGLPEADGFVNKDFRVGGPFLCPYPAGIHPVPRSHPQYEFLKGFESSIYDEIMLVLEKIQHQIHKFWNSRASIYYLATGIPCDDCVRDMQERQIG